MRNFKVYVNGQEYEVAIEEMQPSTPAPQPQAVETKPIVQEPPRPIVDTKASVASGSGQDGEKVEAPFPGVVLKILKANGDKVKKGEAVLVIEAMKMENDIAAPIDGTLLLKVQAGANVETGETLAIIN